MVNAVFYATIVENCNQARKEYIAKTVFHNTCIFFALVPWVLHPNYLLQLYWCGNQGYVPCWFSICSRIFLLHRYRCTATRLPRTQSCTTVCVNRMTPSQSIWLGVSLFFGSWGSSGCRGRWLGSFLFRCHSEDKVYLVCQRLGGTG